MILLEAGTTSDTAPVVLHSDNHGGFRPQTACSGRAGRQWRPRKAPVTRRRRSFLVPRTGRKKTFPIFRAEIRVSNSYHDFFTQGLFVKRVGATARPAEPSAWCLRRLDRFQDCAASLLATCLVSLNVSPAGVRCHRLAILLLGLEH